MFFVAIGIEVIAVAVGVFLTPTWAYLIAIIGVLFFIPVLQEWINSSSEKGKRNPRLVMVGVVLFVAIAGLLSLWKPYTPQQKHVKQQNIERTHHFGLFKIVSITVTDTSAPLLTVDQSSSINLQYLNLGTQPVSGANVSGDVVIAKGLSGTKVFTDFKERVNRQKEGFDSYNAPTYGPGEGVSNTYQTPVFTQHIIDEIMTGEAVIYVLGLVRSNEKPGGMEECLWLQTPSSYPVNPGQMIWHECAFKIKEQ